MRTVEFFINPTTNDIICQAKRMDKPRLVADNSDSDTIAVKCSAGKVWDGMSGTNMPTRGYISVYHVVERHDSSLFRDYTIRLVCEDKVIIEIPLRKSK